MRPRALLAVAVAIALHPAWGSAAPLSSSAVPDAFAWLDRDAPIVVRLDSGVLERIARLARSIGAEAGAGAALATLGSVRYLGFDLFSTRGWQAAGLDPARPALLQLAAIDSAATDRVYRELSRSGGQWGTHREHAPPLWRTRLVVHAADPARAISALSAGGMVERATPVDAEHAARLALLLRAGGRRGVVPDLAALDVVLVGAVPTVGALLFVRRRAELVVVDVVAPFAGDALEWRRDRGTLRELLARPGRGGAPPASRVALGRPGLSVWAHPGGLHDVSQAWRATELLRMRMAGGKMPDLAKTCAGLASLERAALADLAIGVEVGDRAVVVKARYGHRGPLAAALSTEDHALLDGVPGRVLRLQLPLDGLDGLRSLARPALHARGWDALWAVADWCGAGATALIYGFGWPELAGLWLDELVAALPEAATVLAGIANLGAAIERTALSRRELLGVVELSLRPVADDTARAVLDALFGPGRARDQHRSHRLWGRGPLHPYLIAGAPTALGVGFGPSSEWRLGIPAMSPDTRARQRRPPPLLTIRGRLDRLLPMLTERTSWTGLGKAAAARVAAFRIDGTTTASTLELVLAIDLR